MEQRSLRAAFVAAAVALAVIGGGCTGSEVLEADRGQISFQVQMSSNANPPFAFATFKVSQIPFQPTDPAANQSQQDPLALLPAGIAVDLNGTSSATASTVTVTSQTYEMLPFSMTEFNLNVDPVSPAGSSCNGSTVTSIRPAYDVVLTPTCVFTVPRTGPVVLLLTIDGDGLATLLASRLNCSNLSFDGPSAAEIAPYFSFQCGP